MSNQCNPSDFRIYTFTEEELREIASQYHNVVKSKFFGFDIKWDSRPLYSDDGELTYTVDPNLHPTIKATIAEQYGYLSTLLGIKFTDATGNGMKPELSFSEFLEKDYLEPEVRAGGIFDAHNVQIRFREASDLPLDVEANTIKDIVNHETLHFLNLDHSEESRSKELNELSKYFLSSVVTNEEKGITNYKSTSVAPLDIYELQIAMDNRSGWSKFWGEKERELNYVDYYDLTGKLQVPSPESSGGTLHITLGSWAADRELAVFEMPRKNADGTKDIAIISSSDFVIIPNVLNGNYTGIDFSIVSEGTTIAKSETIPVNGSLSLKDIQDGLLSTIQKVPENWFKEPDQIPMIPELKEYCNSQTMLEDTQEIALGDSPKAGGIGHIIKYK